MREPQPAATADAASADATATASASAANASAASASAANAITVTIDGQPCAATDGQFVKEVANSHGIDIPTLCHHSALPGQACCRLCLVEAGAPGRVKKVVASCVFPSSDGLEVLTQTEKLRRLRKNLLELLIDRAPSGEGRLAAYCAEYGVSDPYSPRDQDEKCILCGLCAKACDELGNSAISTVLRGVDKKVSTAFGEIAARCIGCGACAKVCPTGKIELRETDGTRWVWEKSFELLRCSECGRPFATADELAWLERRIGAVSARGLGEPGATSLPACAGPAEPLVCPSCRVARAAASVRALT
jgi:ferredoxin